ncbi:hypothetical protein QJS66_08635 [Kocuria rhizophila]|nr:hypothetical protein QJS66_08635 [Kocuria rhizophila]
MATYGGMDIPTVTVFMDGLFGRREVLRRRQGRQGPRVEQGLDSQNGTFLRLLPGLLQGQDRDQNLVGDGADVVLPVAGQAARGHRGRGGRGEQGQQERAADPGRTRTATTTLDSGKEFLLSPRR